MIRAALLVATATLAACGGARRPPTGTDDRCSGLHGVVRDAATHEPLEGATIVPSDRAMKDAAPVVTEADGTWIIPSGDYGKVTVYYQDTSSDVPWPADTCAEVVVELTPER